MAGRSHRKANTRWSTNMFSLSSTCSFRTWFDSAVRKKVQLLLTTCLMLLQVLYTCCVHYKLLHAKVCDGPAYSQPASMRPCTHPVLLTVTLLIAQVLASGHGVPAAVNLLAYFQVFFVEKCRFLVATIPLDIKPSRCFEHGLYASVGKISPSYDMAFRRR